MRRPLVLSSEAARHPFRASLPLRVFQPEERSGPQIGMQDLRDFLLAYCACFLAVSLYLA